MRSGKVPDYRAFLSWQLYFASERSTV